MSESDIKELEAKLSLLKANQQKNEFQKILNEIASTDYTKILENKIFECEIGCWIRQGNITRYPEKIYKYVNEKITEYESVSYHLLGKDISEYPKDIADILKLHRFPDQICSMTIDKNCNYTYVFSQKFLSKYAGQIYMRGLQQNNQSDYFDIYKILYSIVKNK